jgi:DNA-nicking Smr family endonuclease
MGARVRTLTETDAATWAGYASQIAPLRGRRAFAAPAASPGEAPTENDVAVGRRPVAVVSASKTRTAPIGVGGPSAGIDRSTWERFRRGQLGAVRKLDLHGMTAREAFAALRAFLRAAHADRVRCVEVVTGRGNGEVGGVLRRELPMWLNLPDIRPMVLAAAHPRISNAMHSNVANPGSVRLLLRRPKGAMAE